MSEMMAGAPKDDPDVLQAIAKAKLGLVSASTSVI